ncbi:sigma-54 dependent transcriptional regulator [Rhodoferax sp. U11-2br]|uniref:sigma-54-dependent transcriptional regulator n=1 Tax=Rhodoferax sp. U11-2br TaxID=2838878 RepID=UPI001BEB8D13|nr:sigma-54 dependent transcriptional regulator [Rhodoferax sp. U11-2br]MBT3065298.1 sigma-54 dependent transcriptional regulator [Rhodoferax sp. U11-2br]
MNSPDLPFSNIVLPLVLVVDDETHSLDAIRRNLEEDFSVLTATSAEEARKLLEQHEVSVILCDQRMPGTTGVKFLGQVRELWPDTVRIIISGYTDSQDIIAGINEAGIYQYLPKPWLPEHLLTTVGNAVEARSLQLQTQRLNLELRTSAPVLRQLKQLSLATAQAAFDFDTMVRAPGSPLDAVCDMAARVARYDLAVLVTGESGTGKELLARAIHYASPRSERAFVMENCAAMSDTLLESELFGHKRGSFTGAFEDHVGLFQRADGGTVFLDEIGDTSPAFQVKLLRVLQEGEVRPVGASRPVGINVRVIAATHRDLEQDVRSGRFREDLYYRIASITLSVPPLRERSADILPIAQALLSRAGVELGHPNVRFAKDVPANLLAHPWPGNIRELKNEIYRAVALSDGETVSATSFSQRVLYGQPGQAATAQGSPLAQSGSLQERLDAIEAVILRETMLRHRWNKTHAAKELGLSRVGLRQKLARFGMEGQTDA